MKDDQDNALVDAVIAGDDSAFDELVLKYQRQLAALVARITGNPGEAADVVQKVFLKAYTKLSGFKRLSTFKTWLFSIAINLSRNALRQKKRWGIPQDIEDVNPKVDDDQDENLIRKQRRLRLNHALENLPPKQKSVVVLRIYEELSFAQIAESVGITENAAKVNFHHAVKSLKGILNE